MYRTPFKFIDLFAGIGGFHAALTQLGGECVYSSEIDPDAASIYELNWGIKPSGDIKLDVSDLHVRIPNHDVLAAGFPCQPFSKSGFQAGMEESRGTLFWYIAKVVETKKPKMVILENVRNLSGPRHEHEWKIIIRTLRNLNYRVESEPLIISPHKIHPKDGGSPQTRERVYILATLERSNLQNPLNHTFSKPSSLPKTREWDPSLWDLTRVLGANHRRHEDADYLQISEDETKWIKCWDELSTAHLKKTKTSLPGFPLWLDTWKKRKYDFDNIPEWKKKIIQKNILFYKANSDIIDPWLLKWDPKKNFPESRRKLEWQAGENKSIWDGLIQFRPSGIRDKRANYSPALVAINQTPIIGPLRRRISVREALDLQGFPKNFDFGNQAPSKSYKQVGNAIHVGSAIQAIRMQISRDKDLIAPNSRLNQLVTGFEER